MRPVFAALLGQWLGPWAGWLVPTYPVMVGLGCLLGAVIFVENARRWAVDRRQALGAAMVGYAAGLAGAAAVPMAQGLIELARHGAFRLQGGITAYGGLLGGTVAAVWWMRRQKLPALALLDAAAPGAGVGYFFGRLGCFLAGCDYGVPTARPWGVRFPAGSHAFRDHLSRGLIEADSAWSLPVHPTQLYLAFSGLLLGALCASLPARGDGRRLLAYACGYAALRSLIELLRGDEGRGLWGPLSTSQILAAVSVGLALWLVRAERQRAAG